jgi:hypothetical protein
MRAKQMNDANVLTRLNNDVNGNPRYAIHFLKLNTRAEKNRTMQDYSTTDLYNIAVKRANKIGGKRYYNKSYGGIVFQSYNTTALLDDISNLITELNLKDERLALG